MALDSAAVFSARLEAIGIEQEHRVKFAEKGWNTMGDFAFSSSYTPGQADDTAFITKVITPIFGVADHPKTAALRRLFYDAFTCVAAGMKSKLERTDDDAPKRLPLEERTARYEKLKSRLIGMNLVGQLECSHALVDKCVQMAEDNILRHVPWEDCTMRQQELEGVKKVKEWRPDALGHMKEKVHPDNPKADLGSDLLLKYALQRRGMAFEQALIMKFEVHELLVDRLLCEYLRTPPAGYRVINLDQLLRTDKEIFRRMAEETRGGIVADAMGSLPLEAALKKVLYEPGVQMFLLPMPATSPSAASSSGVGGGAAQQAAQAPAASRKAAKRARAEASRLASEKAEAPHDQAAKRGDKGKGRGAAAARVGPRMPQALIGMAAMTDDNRPLCFNFNLAGCPSTGVVVGQRCDRGWHLCCRPGCFQEHSLAQCPKK